jgi:hypothetical protein
MSINDVDQKIIDDFVKFNEYMNKPETRHYLYNLKLIDKENDGTYEAKILARYLSMRLKDNPDLISRYINRDEYEINEIFYKDINAMRVNIQIFYDKINTIIHKSITYIDDKPQLSGSCTYFSVMYFIKHFIFKTLDRFNTFYDDIKKYIYSNFVTKSKLLNLDKYNVLLIFIRQNIDVQKYIGFIRECNINSTDYKIQDIKLSPMSMMNSDIDNSIMKLINVKDVKDIDNYLDKYSLHDKSNIINIYIIHILFYSLKNLKENMKLEKYHHLYFNAYDKYNSFYITNKIL